MRIKQYARVAKDHAINIFMAVELRFLFAVYSMKRKGIPQQHHLRLDNHNILPLPL